MGVGEVGVGKPVLSPHLLGCVSRKQELSASNLWLRTGLLLSHTPVYSWLRLLLYLAVTKWPIIRGDRLLVHYSTSAEVGGDE